MYKKELPVEIPDLFQQIRDGIKNATVSCKLITNDDIPQATVWAVEVTATALTGYRGEYIGVTPITVVRRSPWYEEGTLISSYTLKRDMDNLISMLATALGRGVFLNPSSEEEE